MAGKSMTVDEIRAAARHAAVDAGSRQKFAESIGMSQSHLSEVLSGARTNIPDKLLDALGIERVVVTTYRRKAREKADG